MTTGWHDPGNLARLGASLRLWRVLNRVKQAALAESFGVSQTTISRWEAGAVIPNLSEARRITAHLAARPNSAADRALLDLVRGAGAPVHLICDLTHRLLAASPARARDWHVPVEDLIGRSLWRYASSGIARAEAALAEAGWYTPLPQEICVQTERAEYDALTIRAGEIRWVRLPLSDGRFARLVTDGARA